MVREAAVRDLDTLPDDLGLCLESGVQARGIAAGWENIHTLPIGIDTPDGLAAMGAAHPEVFAAGRPALPAPAAAAMPGNPTPGSWLRPDLGEPIAVPPVSADTIPEPASWTLLLGGFAMIGTVARGRRGNRRPARA